MGSLISNESSASPILQKESNSVIAMVSQWFGWKTVVLFFVNFTCMAISVLVLTICYEIKRRLQSRQKRQRPIAAPLYQPPLETFTYPQQHFPCYQDPVTDKSFQNLVHNSQNCGNATFEVVKAGDVGSHFVHIDSPHEISPQLAHTETFDSLNEIEINAAHGNANLYNPVPHITVDQIDASDSQQLSGAYRGQPLNVELPLMHIHTQPSQIAS